MDSSVRVFRVRFECSVNVFFGVLVCLFVTECSSFDASRRLWSECSVNKFVRVSVCRGVFGLRGTRPLVV